MTSSDYAASKNLDDLFALLERMKAEELAAGYAFHMAYGQYSDSADPEGLNLNLEYANCVVTVLENKLWGLSLSEEIARQPDGVFTSMTINSTVQNAWRIWKADYDRLYQAALTRLLTDTEARRKLRAELEQNAHR